MTVKMKALIFLLNLRDGAKRGKPVYPLYSCNAKATLGEESKSGGPGGGEPPEERLIQYPFSCSWCLCGWVIGIDRCLLPLLFNFSFYDSNTEMNQWPFFFN